MEIMIIGGALVALMIFVSTRIKKTSAKAFNRETIVTDKYNFFKPEGYLIPAAVNSPFLIEAYSKDKGTDERGKLNQSWATLKVYQNGNFDEITHRAQKNTANIISDDTARDGDLSYYFMHGETLEEGFGSEIFYKIIGHAKSGEVYELQVSILNDYQEAFSSKASAMLQSFTLNTGQLQETKNKQ